jgi:hypothetical protein
VILSDSLPFGERAKLPLACLTSLAVGSCGAFPGWTYDFVE